MTTIDPGTLVEIDGRPTLRFERRFDAPVDRVWLAVTDHDEMQAWFPARVDGERRVGATLTFTFEQGEGPTQTGTVLEWDPPRSWTFDWADTRVRIAIEPDGDGTRMVFTDTPFDPSLAAMTGAGWHECIVALDHHVAGLPAPEEDTWPKVYDDYVDRFGPPLATRGDDGSLTWHRWHFVEPDRLRELAAPIDGDWAFEEAEHGVRYRVTLPADTRADDAARLHARLLELDLKAASGQDVPSDPARWVDAYRRLVEA